MKKININVSSISDETYYGVTEGGFHYNTTWISVVGRREFKFYVQACQDAQLALVTSPGETHFMAYEVIIGMTPHYSYCS